MLNLIDIKKIDTFIVLDYITCYLKLIIELIIRYSILDFEDYVNTTGRPIGDLNIEDYVMDIYKLDHIRAGIEQTRKCIDTFNKQLYLNDKVFIPDVMIHEDIINLFVSSFDLEEDNYDYTYPVYWNNNINKQNIIGEIFKLLNEKFSDEITMFNEAELNTIIDNYIKDAWNYLIIDFDSNQVIDWNSNQVNDW